MLRAVRLGESQMIVNVLHDVREDFGDFDDSFLTSDEDYALDCLTHRKDEPYEAYIDRVLASELAMRAKRVDLIDNMDLSRLPAYERPTPATRARLRKYRAALRRIQEVLGHGTKEEVAWSAGLFEGEGCILFRTTGAPGGLSLVMTDEDCVHRFCEYVGLGHVSMSREATTKLKAVYQWRVSSQAETYAVLQLLLPYLGERRTSRAYDALVWLNKHGVGYKQWPLSVGESCSNGHMIQSEDDLYPVLGRPPRCLVCHRAQSRVSAAKKRVPAVSTENA